VEPLALKPSENVLFVDMCLGSEEMKIIFSKRLQDGRYVSVYDDGSNRGRLMGFGNRTYKNITYIKR